MKEEKPVHYEPHPVTAERKAELVAQGVRIVDAIYKPADEPDVAEAVAAPIAPVVRRGRPPRA